MVRTTTCQNAAEQSNRPIYDIDHWEDSWRVLLGERDMREHEALQGGDGMVSLKYLMAWCIEVIKL